MNVDWFVLGFVCGVTIILVARIVILEVKINFLLDVVANLNAKVDFLMAEHRREG